MDYRNDLEAARLRINTLEAKLEESKASIEARDAELAECTRERDRLRQTTGTKSSRSPGMMLGIAALGFALASGLGFTLGARSAGSTGQTANVPPLDTAPIVTISENGTKAEGRINQPKEEPPVPNAKAEGQIDIPTSITSAATVAGQTNVPTSEGATIESVVESARPKIKSCYREERKQYPKASGSVSVVFDIERSGKLTRTKLETYPHVQPWWSKTFEACVVDVYRNLTFPSPGDAKTTASGKYFLSALDDLTF